MIINDQRGSSHGQTISYMYMTLVEIHQCVCECVILLYDVQRMCIGMSMCIGT